MGVLSAVPFFNWMAWVLAAFESSSSPAFYYAFAGVYALPWLHAGLLGVDGLAVFSLLVGAAQVQVERVAETEPGSLRLPGGDAQGLLARARREAGDAGERARTAVAVTAVKVASEARAVKDAEQRLAEEERAEWEKEDFDRRLRERGRGDSGGS